MSLQLVIGNSGAGKSTYLYERVISRSLKEPGQTFLYIVPEQFTMQTQQEFVRRHPKHGILNIDVLSFQRLAYRVFDEVGGFFVPVLDDVGKLLVLRKVCENKKKEFQMLSGSLGKLGTIDELKSILSEFMQYRVSPEELTQWASHTTNRGLQTKLMDLQVLYDGFFQYLEEKFITSEQVLEVLCRVIDQSRLVKNSVIVLDGFTGFTPLQNEVLVRLLQLSKKVTVALTMEKNALGRGQLAEHELFALSAKTAETLRRLAQTAGTLMEETLVIEGGKKGRLCEAPALSFLEQNLFRPHSRPYEGTDAGQYIHIREAQDPVAELSAVAAEIRRLVREEGYRYRQIAVVSGDMASYGEYLRRVFDAYEIPCFLDDTTPLLMNPMIDLIRALLEIVEKHFSYESVFHYLRCGLSGLTMDEIDRLENYVLAFGIRGQAMWQETWVRKTEEMTPEHLEQLNALRLRFVEQLWPFADVCRTKTTVKEKTVALYECLRDLKLQELLEEKSEAFAAAGELALAKEYGQVYGVIMHLLEQYVELLGEEALGVEEYARLLEAGLSAPKIGVLPPGTDYVAAGDIERTRLTDIAVLFFVGLNDGIVPKMAGGGGILSELEREDLKEAQIELAPTMRETFFTQRFYLYLLVTKASKKLYLSYAGAGFDKAGLRPSYFIQTIRTLFPMLPVERQEEQKKFWNLETTAEALEWMRAALVEERDEPLWSEVFRTMYARAAYRPALRRMQEAHAYSHRESGIGRALATELYGGLQRISVTRLEAFSSCPYAHFLQYGLRLAERKRYEFTAAESGTIFHEALERYANALSLSGHTMADDLGEYQRELADRCLEESLAGLGGSQILSTARGTFHVERMKRLMRKTVWAIGHQLRRGSFLPANFELDFSAAGNIYQLPLDDGQTSMGLVGRIDRMDVLEEDADRYLRIVDYKSGRQTFSLEKSYYGLQLQLIVYLQAAMRLEKALYPDRTIVPAGIFYYRLDDPVLEEQEETPAQKEERLLRALRLDGYVNRDSGIIKKMDHTGMAISSVIPVAYKKDGSLKATGTKTATTKQLEAFMAHSDRLLKELGTGILDGVTDIAPTRLAQASPCMYCGYRSVCGFDRRLSCYQYRSLRRLSEAEIWERMEEEACGQPNNSR